MHAELREALEPLLQEIEPLNERIQEYEVRMEKIAQESYPQVELLKQVKWGRNADRADVCADPGRSASVPEESRRRLLSGLRPGRRDSGESQPQMHISKEGDPYLRTMLVQGAHYILGPLWRRQ